MLTLFHSNKFLLIGAFLYLFAFNTTYAVEIGFRGNSVELYNQYKANPFTFKRKMEDKIIIVSARIQEIGEDFEGNMSIQLPGGNLFGWIDAQIQDSEEEKLLRLQRGSRVTLACEDIDEMIDVALHNCRILTK